ncbi:MAG: MazG nucleotide pyrophosphohydrolase domain-containing protein [Patescibacteria group bacterium]|nr:MazG nucleotide pyrophosphohydrolase domain-containing protein [Patescibacteria group bacterium]
MHFKEIQSKVMKHAKAYEKKYKVKIDEEFAMIKIVEEVGEFAQAVLIHKHKSRPEKFVPKKESLEHIAEELSDVVGMALVNADLLGIDLEKALKKKWID